MWEDEYDPTNPKFPCKVDRTAGPLEPSQQLNLINHNLNTNIIPIGRGLRIPDRLDSPRTNSFYSYVWFPFPFFSFMVHATGGGKVNHLFFLFRIEAHAEHCAPLANQNRPNFVLLDFVNIGQAPIAVAHLNGFPY